MPLIQLHHFTPVWDLTFWQNNLCFWPSFPLSPAPDVSYRNVLGSFPFDTALKFSQLLFRPPVYGMEVEKWVLSHPPQPRHPRAAGTPVSYGIFKQQFASGLRGTTCLCLSLLRYSWGRWLFPIAACFKVLSSKKRYQLNQEKVYFSDNGYFLEIYTNLLHLLALTLVNL